MPRHLAAGGGVGEGDVVVGEDAEGIRVNAVCPGAVDTHMLYSERDDTVDEVRQMNLADIPEGRIPDGSEVAELVAFLADDRSRHVNGANLSIDGGYTAR